jgi:hypothetical protein
MASEITDVVPDDRSSLHWVLAIIWTAWNISPLATYPFLPHRLKIPPAVARMGAGEAQDERDSKSDSDPITYDPAVLLIFVSESQLISHGLIALLRLYISQNDEKPQLGPRPLY